MKTLYRRALSVALLALLSSLFASAALYAPGAAASTTAQTTTSHPPSSIPFQGRGHPTVNSGYDEQLGITFTQNFTSLRYNVTAVEQTDPTLGTGPGYLLSGISNTGAWYQVGLSWNWSPGSGFAMSYEVFDAFGNSVFPTNGGGGLTALSGPVNPGDNVTLDLYFASGQVVMQANDTATGAYAQETYSASGSTYFVGQPNSDSNSIGFFTGLMTEWYHGQPYYANPQQVVYSTGTPVSSAWMWMDEFNANTNQLVFASNATAVSSFTSNATQLQEFSYGGITQYASAYQFITGGSSSSTTGTATVTSTEVVTATVTTATTLTTATTTTLTSTETTTEPVTTTVTSVQPTTTTVTTTSVEPPSTTTTTETTTETATGAASLPLWSYAAMVVLLLAGLGTGYLLRRPAAKGG